MKLRNIGYLVLSLAVLVMSAACTKSCQKAPKEEAKEKPSVFFESPKDGDVVSSPVMVKFGVKGMAIRPAMEDVNDKKSGHHHLLIDSPQKFIEAGLAIPTDDKHLHFGHGETETTVELAPGVHTLTLQFGDGAHRSYGPDMAATISITVKAPELKAPEADAANPGEGAADDEGVDDLE